MLQGISGEDEGLHEISLDRAGGLAVLNSGGGSGRLGGPLIAVHSSYRAMIKSLCWLKPAMMKKGHMVQDGAGCEEVFQCPSQ